MNRFEANELNESIQEHYRMLEYDFFSFMSYEYQKHLYKENSYSLLKITEYLITEEAHEYITPTFSYARAKKKLLELEDIYREII